MDLNFLNAREAKALAPKNFESELHSVLRQIKDAAEEGYHQVKIYQHLSRRVRLELTDERDFRVWELPEEAIEEGGTCYQISW